MKNGIRNCKVCNKVINVVKERNGGTKRFCRTASEEGVYVKDLNSWFCNDCWEKMK